MKEKPNFYAILPATVRYDKRLNAIQKLFYAEISALSTKEKRCWATNKYFEEVFDVSTSTVTRALNGLIDTGYLKREIIYKDGTKEIERRYLCIVETANTPIVESDYTPIVENEEENNTSIYQYKNNNKYIVDSNECDESDGQLELIPELATEAVAGTEGKTKAKEEQLQEDFEKLWKLYPNKKGKTAAFKAYKKAMKDGATNKEIQTGIVAYRKQIKINHTEERYIKHGGTFFNQRCWEDEDLKLFTKTTEEPKQQEATEKVSEVTSEMLDELFKNY